MSEHRSTSDTHFRNCPLCEAHCGVAIQADIENNQVTSVRGDAEDFFSQGYICPRPMD